MDLPLILGIIGGIALLIIIYVVVSVLWDILVAFLGALCICFCGCFTCCFCCGACLEENEQKSAPAAQTQQVLEESTTPVVLQTQPVSVININTTNTNEGHQYNGTNGNQSGPNQMWPYSYNPNGVPQQHFIQNGIGHQYPQPQQHNGYPGHQHFIPNNGQQDFRPISFQFHSNP